ncbi:MAG TPA: DinB family protein [Salegentibacter sp.]|nr:DinB family protein [Salegentibacter sp.]
MKSSESRQQLVKHLMGGEAFIPIQDFIQEFPFEKLGERPPGLPYSFYEVFYHIRFTQKDILDFCLADSYKTPNWPEAYWPDSAKPENEAAWEKLKEHYFQERDHFASFILNKENKLQEPVKNARDQSLLREIMLVVEHTAYHTGQLLVISRLLGVYSG